MAKQVKQSKPEFALIRAKSPDQIQLFNDVKKATGEKTNSGALMEAARLYLRQQKEIKELNELAERNDKRIAELTTVLKFAYHANEMVAAFGAKNFPKGKFPQTDLFQ